MRIFQRAKRTQPSPSVTQPDPPKSRQRQIRFGFEQARVAALQEEERVRDPGLVQPKRAAHQNYLAAAEACESLAKAALIDLMYIADQHRLYLMHVEKITDKERIIAILKAGYWAVLVPLASTNGGGFQIVYNSRKIDIKSLSSDNQKQRFNKSQWARAIRTTSRFDVLWLLLYPNFIWKKIQAQHNGESLDQSTLDLVKLGKEHLYASNDCNSPYKIRW